MDESREISEIIDVDAFGSFEKPEEVQHAVSIIDQALAEGASPRLLLKGGPGVGKSTASYELLEFLQEERGCTSIWVQPEELGSHSFKDKIEQAGQRDIIFIDSIDVVLTDNQFSEGLEEVVKVLNDREQQGEGPMLIANIHDPYLVKKGEEIHEQAREALLGEDGIFHDVSQHIRVEDEFPHNKARDRALEKAIEESGIHISWIRFLSDQMENNKINKHSEMSNIFSKWLMESENLELPPALLSEYNATGEEAVMQWMNTWIPIVRKQNEKFVRAYYHPDSEEEAWKGLVRMDISPTQKATGEVSKQLKSEVELDDSSDEGVIKKQQPERKILNRIFSRQKKR